MHPVKSECILTYYADYSIIMFMGIPETVGGQSCSRKGVIYYE